MINFNDEVNVNHKLDRDDELNLNDQFTFNAGTKGRSGISPFDVGLGVAQNANGLTQQAAPARGLDHTNG